MAAHPKPEPRPMKPPRYLKRTAIARSTKRIPRENARQKAKRAKAYKAFLSSVAWKRMRREAIERAGRRCEETVLVPMTYGTQPSIVFATMTDRCNMTETLTVDHLTYARFGGDELPEDLRVVCRFHHMRHHALQGKRVA